MENDIKDYFTAVILAQARLIELKRVFAHLTLEQFIDRSNCWRFEDSLQVAATDESLPRKASRAHPGMSSPFDHMGGAFDLCDVFWR